MNYLSTIWATAPGDYTDKSIMGEPSKSTRSSIATTTPLSSLSSISSRPRSNSYASLSSSFSSTSLPSCTASDTSSESPRLSESTLRDNDQERKTSIKRAYSTLTINRGESGTIDETFKIKVSCNNCYLWRKKCKKQEATLESLQSEIARVKGLNMQLTNKLNEETKGYRMRERRYVYELEENKMLIQDLQRENEDQLKMINDMKHENEAIKLEKNELEREKQKLSEDITETKKHGERLLSVVNTLQEKVIKIQAQINNEDSLRAEGFQDSQNPWYWVLKMT